MKFGTYPEFKYNALPIICGGVAIIILAASFSLFMFPQKKRAKVTKPPVKEAPAETPAPVRVEPAKPAHSTSPHKGFTLTNEQTGVKIVLTKEWVDKNMDDALKLVRTFLEGK